MARRPTTPTDELRGALVLRDILDGQLESVDGRRIGRVADLEGSWHSDGRLRVTAILVGPAALAGRVSARFRGLATRWLGDRFEHRIEIEQVEEVGPTVRLVGRAVDYSVAAGDRWVLDHVLRFIPGNGREDP